MLSSLGGCLVFAGFTAVGFCGGRSVGGGRAAAAAVAAAAVAAAGVPVLVGCANGVDLAVRTAVSSAQIFRAASSRPGHLVARSCQFVAALAAHERPLLVVVPGVGAPAGLRPSHSWQSCGSGSWSSAALAAGRSVAVLVQAPAASWLPQWNFEFNQAFGGWLLRPPARQMRML